MGDPYQRAQQLLDKAGAPEGDLANRIIAVLENQTDSHYAEMRQLVAVVNDCLDRLAKSLDFEREYSHDPAFELSETIAGIENVLPDQHARIQRYQQQLSKIQMIAAGEELPAATAPHVVVSPDKAAAVVAALTDDVPAEDAVVPVGRASTREARPHVESEEPQRILGPEDLSHGWSQA